MFDIRKKIRSSYSHINEVVILDFFMIYSRLEYALKKSDYSFQNGDKININWKKFKDKMVL